MQLALFLLLAQAGVAPTPTPLPERAPALVVERRLELGHERRRFSLFTNRVAVVTVTLEEQQVTVRTLTLTEAEYQGYLAALAAELARLDQSRPTVMTAERGGHGVITLAFGGEKPRYLEYWTMAVPNLEIGRLIATFDDLESRVLDSSPSEDAMRAWKPQPGDRVELYGGHLGTVERVIDGGMVFVAVEGAPLIEAIPREQWAQRIKRVVARGE